MDFGLTQEQQMIVETVRTFCETELYPHEDLVERLGEVPREIADDISKKSSTWASMRQTSLKKWAGVA